MRTRLLTSAGLLGAMLAGGLVAMAGCDDITSGQLGEQSGPPKLKKVLVQNARPSFAGVVTDLLDTGTPASCDDTHPCAQGSLGYPYGPGTDGNGCIIPMGMTSGTCDDPLVARPPTIDQVTGLNAIRVVFDKALDPKIEQVMIDPMTAQATYMVDPTLAQLIGPDGMPVDLVKPKAAGKGYPGAPGGVFYDPAGSPDKSSVPSYIFFGPAIEVRPAVPLAPNSKYTLKLNGDLIVDRKGQKAVDQNGNPLGQYSIDFTMENLSVVASTPDTNGDGVLDDTIKPDDVITLTFNSLVDETTATASYMCGSTMIKGLAWSDRGTDPTMCDANLNPGQLDIVAVDAMGNPVDLPAGACTLTVSVKDAFFGSGSYTNTFSFMVMGPKDPMDPNAVANFVLPSQCVTAMPDMSMAGGDASSPADGGLNLDALLGG